MFLKFWTRFGYRCILGVVDARHRAGVLRVDTQADLALVAELRFGNDLG